MLLSDLPATVLALILDGQASWNALTLWQTGSSKLQAKLRSGGITQMDLSYPPIGRPANWPRCLQEFRLHSLRISSGRHLLPLHSLRAAFMRLHSGIKVLELSIPGGAEAFSENATCVVTSPDEEDDEKAGEHGTGSNSEHPSSPGQEEDEKNESAEPHAQHSLSHLDESEVRLSDLWDPHKAFPSLESLKLSYVGGNDPSITFDCGALSMVPASVKHLELQHIAYIKWSSLPQGLQSLLDFQIHHPEDPTEVIKSLPKSLTHIRSTANWEIYYDCLREELPNLAVLEGGSLGIGAEDFSLPNFVRGHFNLITPLAQLSESIPGHIETLNVMSPVDLGKTHFLPSSLTSFQTRDLLITEHSTLPHWPSTLTELSIRYNLQPQHFHLLPRTLKTLHTETSRISNRKLTASPSNLTEADCLRNGLALIAGVDARAWQKARSDLIEYGKTRNGVDSEFASAYIAHVESGGLWGLPVSLTQISFESKIWDFGAKIVLPPYLRSFSAGADTLISNQSRYLELLPPFMSNLNMEGDCAKWEFVKQWSPSNPCVHFLNMAHLREIIIQKSGSETSTLYLNLIPLLPRGLLSLHLRCGLPNFEASVLRDLPPSLTELVLWPRGGINPLNAWLHTLPRSLMKLIIDSPHRAVDEFDLVNLPPGLTELSVPMEKLTFDTLWTIPRSIRRFGVTTALLRDGAVGFDESDSSDSEEELASFTELNLLKTEVWPHLQQSIALPFHRIFNNRSKEEFIELYSTWCGVE